MKAIKWQLVLLVLILLSGPAWGAGAFTLTSPQLAPGARVGKAQVFKGFGCEGKNISPALSWTNAPAGTQSFAVTVYDPDAPTGSGWWHWVIFNIPADVTALKENAGDPTAALAPAGSIQSKNDFGANGYGGPCPPVGDTPHRYEFTVFALDVAKLPLDASVSGAMAGFYIHHHTIGKAGFTAYFSR